MQECQFIAGEVIFNEGEESDVAYQVISGRVDIYRRVPGGTVQLGTVEEGEIFGEMGIISDEPRSACAAALTDVTLRVVSRQMLDLLLERQPEIVVQIIRVLMERLRNSNQQIAHFVAQQHEREQYEIAGPGRQPDIHKVTLFPISDALKDVMPGRGVIIGSFPFRIGALPTGESPSVLDWNNLLIHGLDGRIVSRNHFAIQRSEKGLAISDRGSRTGTIVNGIKLGGDSQEYRADLHPGENEIIIGQEDSPYHCLIYWE